MSIQAQVINLLSDLRERFGLTMLFISHDLDVVEYLCDRIVVLYLGKVMEVAPAKELYRAPQHPYTQALLDASPRPDPEARRERRLLQGDIPSPVDPPSGCVFRTRCPYAQDACAATVPPLARSRAGAIQGLSARRHSADEPMMNLEPILAEVLDARPRAIRCRAPAMPHLRDRRAGAGACSRGDLPLPQAVIRDSALAHNHAWMRDFTAATGVLLAPHGKTTMAPQIFAQQLAAGAWGITVANVQQLGICVRFGVRRVIMANQLLGAAEVATVIRLLEVHPDLEFHFLIDSLAQLAAIEAAAAGHTMSRKLTALVELGVPGGRTGCRTFDEAMAVARAVAASAVRRAVGARMLRRPAGQRRFGARYGHGGRADAPDQGGRACLRRRTPVRRPGDHSHRGRVGGVRHRGARTAFASFEAGADDPAQRLLCHARLGLLRSHARTGQGAQRCASGSREPGLQPALEVWSRVQSLPGARGSRS